MRATCNLKSCFISLVQIILSYFILPGSCYKAQITPQYSLCVNSEYCTRLNAQSSPVISILNTQ